MSLDTYDLIVRSLLWITAPAATLFPIIYGITSPWWRSLVGRALVVKGIAVALLIDLSLLLREVELSVLQGQVVGIVVIGLVALGVNLQFAALLVEKARGRAPVPPA